MIRQCLAASLLALSTTSVFAANCSVDVESNDQMRFNTDNIVVEKACKEVTVNFKHTGTMPKAVMGHNIVITSAADVQAVSTEGMGAGVANDYVKADDARVVAHSKVIGGGETDTFTIDVSKFKDGEEYAFFCSFPGHLAIMKGTVTVK